MGTGSAACAALAGPRAIAPAAPAPAIPSRAVLRIRVIVHVMAELLGVWPDRTLRYHGRDAVAGGSSGLSGCPSYNHPTPATYPRPAPNTHRHRQHRSTRPF